MANQSYVLPQSEEYESSTVANGDYNFTTVAPSLPINIIDYFNFVDASGNLVAPTAGSVTITADSGNGIFQEFEDNTFSASDANSTTRAKPSGRGRAETIRVSLSGTVAGNNVAGFKFLLTQSLN